MEPVTNALKLLQRQAQLQARQHAAGGISILEERELFEIPNKLQQFPAAVQAILETAGQLRRPLDGITVRDVEDHAFGSARHMNDAVSVAHSSAS